MFFWSTHEKDKIFPFLLKEKSLLKEAHMVLYLRKIIQTIHSKWYNDSLGTLAKVLGKEDISVHYCYTVFLFTTAEESIYVFLSGMWHY